jgi:hypothetical protein
LIGEFGLFLIVQLFNTYNKTFDVLSLETVKTGIGYIMNQFLFVAPTESLLFHILIPSLVIGLLYVYTERTVLKYDSEEFNQKLHSIEASISTKEEMVDYYRTTGQKKKLAEEKSNLNDLRQKKNELSRKERKARVTDKSLYGRSIYVAVIFAFAIILPNFIFGLYHWFNSDVDFFVFWTSGLGVLYLVSGCWFTFISLRYGWLACILTHAIHNSLTIIIVLLFMGLI